MQADMKKYGIITDSIKDSKRCYEGKKKKSLFDMGWGRQWEQDAEKKRRGILMIDY